MHIAQCHSFKRYRPHWYCNAVRAPPAGRGPNARPYTLCSSRVAAGATAAHTAAVAGSRRACQLSPMTDRDDIIDWLRARAAGSGGAAVADDAPLTGRLGLGLDSVRLVELLLDCELRFGVTLPAEELLAGPPLTVAALAAHVVRLRP